MAQQSYMCESVTIPDHTHNSTNLFIERNDKVTDRFENLYNVIVVDMHGGIIMDEKVVASDETSAAFALNLHSQLREKGFRSLDTVTVIYNFLGKVKLVKK